MNKKERKELISKKIFVKLLKDIPFLERCVAILYEYQTQSEKITGSTKFDNKVGYNKPDSKSLTYYANLIKSGHHLKKENLTDSRNRMIKYASSQLSKLPEVLALLNDDYLRIRGKVRAVKGKGALIQFSDDKEMWIGLSLIHSKNNFENRETQDFLIEKWIFRNAD